MLRSTGEVRRAIGWLLGGVSLVSWDAILVLIPYLAIGMTALCLNGYAFNLLQFGDDQATQMGLNVRRAKFIIIVAASLVTAAAVSFAGIIGFVGLVVPHVVRIWWGVDYRRHHSAQYYLRRIRPTDGGCDCTYRNRTAGITRRHCDGAGGCSIFSMGLTALKESRIMVKIC